jgi:hypothetical protein
MIDAIGETVITQPHALKPEAQAKLEIAQQAEQQAKQAIEETQKNSSYKPPHRGQNVDVVT